MKTTRELIEFLRDTADELEIALEDEEITNELNIQPNSYGMSYPFLATRFGFININNPSTMEEELY